MNDNIKELAEQATVNRGRMRVVDIEKFAELIVQECAEIALTDGQATGNFEVFNKITKHFGVEE